MFLKGVEVIRFKLVRFYETASIVDRTPFRQSPIHPTGLTRVHAALRRSYDSSDEIMHDVSVHIGQAKIASLISVV